MIPLLRRLPELPRVLTLLFLLSAAPLTTAGEYTTHTLQVGDRERQYALYWPDSAPTDRPAASIIAYHGFMSDPSGMRWLTKADPAADAFGFDRSCSDNEHF